MTVVKGFKGFNANLKCRDFQYKKGITYEMPFDDEGNSIQCCSRGFHFCEMPFDVFEYYGPSTGRFCEVEGSGTIDKEKFYDSKAASSKITIGIELTLFKMVSEQLRYILDRRVSNSRQKNTTVQPFSKAVTSRGNSSACAKGKNSIAETRQINSVAVVTNNRSIAHTMLYSSVAVSVEGVASAATTMGNDSVAVSSGSKSLALTKNADSVAICTGAFSTALTNSNRSIAISKGSRSTASVQGRNSIACGFGEHNKVKGALNTFLILAEWGYDDHGHWAVIDVHSTKVDGAMIKACTWYEIKNGQWVEFIEGK